MISSHQADQDQDGQINFAEFFLIVNDLQRYYIAHHDTVDQKAREWSESREDYLRAENPRPLLSLLKSSFLASIHNINEEALEKASGVKQQEMIRQQLQRQDSEEGEEEGVEVIDENNVEDKVWEYEDFKQSERSRVALTSTTGL
jgi:hypothetical protein